MGIDNVRVMEYTFERIVVEAVVFGGKILESGRKKMFSWAYAIQIVGLVLPPPGRNISIRKKKLYLSIMQSCGRMAWKAVEVRSFLGGNIWSMYFELSSPVRSTWRHIWDTLGPLRQPHRAVFVPGWCRVVHLHAFAVSVDALELVYDNQPVFCGLVHAVAWHEVNKD